MEALEKLSQWAGDGAAGHTPSGTPSLEAVQSFEEALAAPVEDVAQISEGVSLHSGAAGLPDTVTLPGPAEDVPPLLPPENTLQSVQTVSGDRALHPSEDVAAVQPEQKEGELVRELGHLLQEITQPSIALGPETLFRAQYLMGILKAQGEAGVKASQQVSQGMESILRQQG